MSVERGNTLPEKGTLERICTDARAMCTHPGKGEPYYESYLEAIEMLSDAYKTELSKT